MYSIYVCLCVVHTYMMFFFSSLLVFTSSDWPFLDFIYRSVVPDARCTKLSSVVDRHTHARTHMHTGACMRGHTGNRRQTAFTRLLICSSLDFYVYLLSIYICVTSVGLMPRCVRSMILDGNIFLFFFLWAEKIEIIFNFEMELINFDLVGFFLFCFR